MDLLRWEKLQLKKQKAEELITFAGGGGSTKIPRYDLLVSNALRRLSARCEKGLETHKDKAYNARQNHQVLSDKEWLIARAMHAVDHAFKFIDKLEGRIPDDGDDDASAIMWAGMCLCAATEALEKQNGSSKRTATMRRRDKRDKQ